MKDPQRGAPDLLLSSCLFDAVPEDELAQLAVCAADVQREDGAWLDREGQGVNRPRLVEGGDQDLQEARGGSSPPLTSSCRRLGLAGPLHARGVRRRCPNTQPGQAARQRSR